MVETSYTVVLGMSCRLFHEAFSVQFIHASKLFSRNGVVFLSRYFLMNRPRVEIEYILERSPTNSTMGTPAVSSLK